MSKDHIIQVEGLSKQYILNRNAAEKSDTLYGNVLGAVKGLRTIGRKKETEEFWALKNVSFEVERGDRVGVIGRNGAGKSTLLKILSRITPPTKGRIEYTGRMASLLEVGTGFHGDLSGRENIYLNGSILGMSKQEIDKKFDEIVAFSEVERFLDTPVKRYSSGMYVRLAFAVAAHLEPEILIVDEVLAVGDAAFQKKCLGKMQDVSTKEGRTILFVSHNMDAVQKLCNKGLLMHKGELLQQGGIDAVISSYISNNALSNGFFEIEKNQIENLSQMGKVLSVSVLNAHNEVSGEIPTGSSWKISIRFVLEKDHDFFVIGYGFQSLFGNPINTSWSSGRPMKRGVYEAVFSNQEIFYTTGQYKIAVGLSNNNHSYFYNDTESFLTISDAGMAYETERIINKDSGLILNQLPVEIREING